MKSLHITKFKLFFAAFCASMLFACQEFEIDSQLTQAPNIQIDALESYTALATVPNNIIFNVSSNTPWNITSDQQWCKVTPAMSSASSLVSEIVVSLEPNTGKTARTATLTIKADQIQETRTITIIQVSKEDLMVIPYDEIVPTEGGKITFTLASNKPWEIIPSTQFVSNIDKKSGPGSETGTTETITLDIPANSGAKREGILTVKTDFQTYSFTVSQNGIIIEQEEDPENFSISATGLTNEKIIKIRANKEWKAEVPQEYRSWLQAEAISLTELKITTTVNNRLTNRKGNIILKTKEIIAGFDGVSFEVIQTPAFGRTGAQSDFVENAENGNLKILGGGIASNFLFKKGKLTYEFESINMSGASWIEFNIWTDFGTQPNFHLHFKPGIVSNFTAGGGYNWTQKLFTWDQTKINATKKVEFIVDNKPGSPNLLIIKAIIDGVEVAVLDNNIQDIYATGDNVRYPGQTLYLKLISPNGASNFTIKSITWQPIN